ncbi:MAG: hydrogenase nickel incorporation protein HypB [Aestuariibacter sp.]
MCTHCGCSSDKATLSASTDSAPKRVLNVKQDESTLHLQHALLAGNKAIARHNRRQFEQDNVTCINLMGTPGAGKTQLLETLLKIHAEIATNMLVLEGDQESVNDAQRIETAGGTALQINTGIGCHLDADMIRVGISALSPPQDSLLFIENVGNLVCPALFDLGESARITMMAVTDGEDKPVKYPHMFSQCDLIIINKADLLPYVDFDLKRVQHDISHLNPKAKVLLLSAKTGQGMEAFDAWLQGIFKHG